MNKRTYFLIFGLLSVSLAASSQQKPKSSAAKTAVSKNAVKGHDEAKLIAQGYKKVFEEQFDTDLSRWNIWNSGAYNNELQHYQAENLKVDKGILTITAKKEKKTGDTQPGNHAQKEFEYTSGRIESKFTFSANESTPVVRMVGRLKLALGTGMWPAFWSYGDSWPINGEIDIVEGLGVPHSYISNYFYGKNPGRSEVKNEISARTIHAKQNLTDSYHIYELIWEKESLTYLLDGEVVYKKTSKDPEGHHIPNFFGKTHFLALNLAVGGAIFQNLDPTTIQPSSYYVDWVKVYTKNK